MPSGLTFTLGGIEFTGLTAAKTAGKYALEPLRVGAAVEDLNVYHVPNVTGSYTSSSGKQSRPISGRVRYVAAALATLTSTIRADVGTLEAKTLSIIGDDGTTYTRCRLVAARRVSRIVNTGRGTVRVDMEFDFVCYAT
jgi:hypothetical protein